jgi:ribose-phosphate pyrophosphokinase
VQDPHSDVVTALLDRVVIADPLPPLRRALAALGRAALVAPDAGARKRVMYLARALELDVVFAEKVRNTQTGKITGTQVVGELPDCPLLVVDDICDGGRTFTELAAALRTRQAEQRQSQPLHLYVTHGIFSKGLGPLLEHYETIFTRNNWTGDSRCQLV